MVVLVTGASGFVGRQLLQYLHDVHAVTRAVPNDLRRLATRPEVDLLSVEEVRRLVEDVRPEGLSLVARSGVLPRATS